MTRRAVVPVQQRMLRIAKQLYEGRVLSAAWIKREFGVDKATAKRDMRIVSCYLPVELTREFKRGRPRVFHLPRDLGRAS